MMSSGGNDGTLFGATPSQDRNGITNAAYDFEGTSNYIAIPNIAVQGIAPRTYSFWMRTGNQIGGMMLCTGSGTNQDGATFNMRHENGGQFIGFMGGNFWSGGHDYFPTGNVLVNDQQWHHVVTTYDGTTLAFFIDGSFEKSTTGLVLFTDGQTNYVGRSNDQNAGNEAFFTGQLDDIGAWDRVLSDLEIADLFSAQGGPCISTTPVSFTGLASGYLTTDAPIALQGEPAGGVFIGPGITGNTFDPAIAGEGTHSIIYTFVDGDQCVNSAGLVPRFPSAWDWSPTRKRMVPSACTPTPTQANSPWSWNSPAWSLCRSAMRAGGRCTTRCSRPVARRSCATWICRN
ncbi:MAG: LamG domain-containing protein [Flavobacteriales bacterium]|nr:LamG domain-containing protein [Flavobacteriales bacterium]